MACALSKTFVEALATDKMDGHAPVELLYRIWQSHPVGLSANSNS